MRPRIIKRSQRPMGMSVQQIEPINRTQLPGAINNVPQELPDGLVTYPLTVADGVKGGSSAIDPLSLDIVGLPTGTLATTTELAINNGTVNEKTTLSDLATFFSDDEVRTVATYADLLAIAPTEDMVVRVLDASGDPDPTISGQVRRATYSYDTATSTWIRVDYEMLARNGASVISGYTELGGDLLHDTIVDQQDYGIQFNRGTGLNTSSIRNEAGFAGIYSQADLLGTGDISDVFLNLQTSFQYYNTSTTKPYYSIIFDNVSTSDNINYQEYMIHTVGSWNATAITETFATDDTIGGTQPSYHKWTVIDNMSTTADTNIVKFTSSGISSTAYPETRDDTGITTPINFIYSDGTGNFLSAPLSVISPTITGRIETASFSLLTSDFGNIVHVDNSASNIDIQLPDPTTVETRKKSSIKVVNATNNQVQFLSFGSETIDGANPYVWGNPAGRQVLEIYTDGTNRFIS